MVDVDVYESVQTRGQFLLVKRDTGRMAAPAEVRARFIPGYLVTRVRILSTDTILGLNVTEAIEAIRCNRYFVAQGSIDFGRVIGQRRPL